MAGIDKDQIAETRKLSDKLLGALLPIQRELTKQGKIEEAISVKKLIDGLNSTKLTAVSAIVDVGEKLSLVDADIPESILKSDAPVLGIHE